MTVKKISNSELTTWRRCQRKWWLTYYRRLLLAEEEKVGARALGTRVHYALAMYYDGTCTSQQAVEAFAAQGAEDREKLIEQELGTKQLDDELVLGSIMLQGYFEWLAETGHDDGLEIISAEKHIEVEILPDVWLQGKLDARVKRTFDGARFFIDHKTVQNFTDPVKILNMDTQMLTYQLLERLLAVDEPVIGGIYNMLRKVKRTANAKPPFYLREEAYHNVVELRNYWSQVHAVVTQIANATRLLDDGADHHYVVPPNPRKECTWDCDFFAVCPLLNDGSAAEELIAAAYIVGDPYARYEDNNKQE